MIINANTKIAAIIKHHPKALDAIVSINPHFEKLRNPILRKVMAGRTSLAAASRFGNCSVDDFYRKLTPLGFQVDKAVLMEEQARAPKPDFIINVPKQQLVDLDVRPVIASGSDPLNLIMEKVKSLHTGEVLRIINTFEPTPLILLLQKKGFKTYVETLEKDLIHTWFYKEEELEVTPVATKHNQETDWDLLLNKWAGTLVEIDVSQLEMPQPMMKILEAIDHLPVDKALFVKHKRIPVFLLPELAQRSFDYRVKEVADGEVYLLIFRDNLNVN
ncbi:MAG: DUF2249 domain-containing protein [Candidatus Dadabacteria bacterium]